MDDFDDSFGNGGGPANGGGSEEADPAAEFLAREQSNLAGLEDEIPPVTVNVTNGTSERASPTPSAETVQLRSTSPSIISQGNGIPREEPEKIRIWREEQKTRLEIKDREEETKKDELKEAAKKELEEWYKGHEEQIVNNRKANRSAEKELVADTDPMEPGTEWERIAKLCDFNPKGSKHQKDISRMRSIILQLKQTPPMKRE
ncbi:unnamed protein product [Orchesella dallaii]|uniref:Clathrin light chain n=1 Tax=Orchesella dallaii TaxID=48710 RepID=A0ABP1PUJ2_9HEXA